MALIETHDLDTATQLVAELLPVTGRLWSAFRDGRGSPDWLFRGQRDARWGLQPSAFRPDPFAAFLQPDDDDLPAGHTAEQRRELHHVMQFVSVADDLGHHIPGDSPELRDPRPRGGAVREGGWPDLFPPTPYLYMFALAQHYGVPTRLLDWTFKPLAAAYFAAVGKPAPDGSKRLAVWALSRQAVEATIGGRSWEDHHSSFVAFISAPTATNPNLAAQAGCFSVVHEKLWGHPEGATLSDRVPNVERLVEIHSDRFKDEDQPVIYKFTLPEEQLSKLLELLAEHRVHAGTLFPGLAGVAEALRERTRYR